MRRPATPGIACSRRAFRGNGKLVPPERALALALCLIAVAATYANTLANGFVFDDRATVTENRDIRSLTNLPKIFLSDYWSGSGRETQNYRPLQMASLAVDYAVYGVRPWGFHLTSLLFHLFAVAMTFLVASRFTHSVLGAALAAAIFGLHPVVSEAVNSVSWRGDLMVVGFLMASVLGYTRYSDTAAGPRVGRNRFLALALFSFALACLSKETGLTTVGVILAYEWLLGSGASLKRLAERMRCDLWPAYLGYAGVAAGYLALRTAVLGRVFHSDIGFIENPMAFEPVLEQKALALSLVTRYGLLLLWPSRLSVDYSYRSLPLNLGWTSPDVICGAVALIGAAALAIWCRRRCAAAALGVLWGLTTYSLTANLVFPIQTMMAERFLTLPAAGWAMCWAGLVDGYVTDVSDRWRRLIVTAAAAMLVVFACRTALRNHDWKDSLTLFESALAVVPTSAKVNYGLGYLYSESDTPADLARAEEAYARAVSIWPGYVAAWSDRALALAKLGRHEAAVQSARRATEAGPADVLSWNNLGFVLYQAGRPDEAAVAFRTAVGMNPAFEPARKNLEELMRGVAPTSALQ